MSRAGQPRIVSNTCVVSVLIWGAYAPRVRAIAPSRSRISRQEDIAARAPQSARESRALPRNVTRGISFHQIPQSSLGNLENLAQSGFDFLFFGILETN